MHKSGIGDTQTHMAAEYWGDKGIEGMGGCKHASAAHSQSKLYKATQPACVLYKK